VGLGSLISHDVDVDVDGMLVRTLGMDNVSVGGAQSDWLTFNERLEPLVGCYQNWGFHLLAPDSGLAVT
jgi:hypothetical protein